MTPLKQVVPQTHAADSVIVGTFQEQLRSATDLAVLSVAFIRDTFMANNVELLRNARTGPAGVPEVDLKTWYLSLDPAQGRSLEQQHSLLSGGEEGQSSITVLSRTLQR